jgi:hypothetical protein
VKQKKKDIRFLLNLKSLPAGRQVKFEICNWSKANFFTDDTEALREAFPIFKYLITYA